MRLMVLMELNIFFFAIFADPVCLDYSSNSFLNSVSSDVKFKCAVGAIGTTVLFASAVLGYKRYKYEEKLCKNMDSSLDSYYEQNESFRFLPKKRSARFSIQSICWMMPF